MVNAAWEGESQVRTWWRSDTDVQTVRYILDIGVKDTLNHLTTDSLRSVPQESWS